MSLHKLLLSPGINTEGTPTFMQGGWSESNHIRWRDGFLEKQLGFVSFTDELLTGIPRSLHAYQSSDNIKRLIAGTHRRLQMLALGVLWDITPLRVAQQNVAVSLDTTLDSPTVNVTDVAHGALSGDEVVFRVPVAIGGLVLYGHYTITVVDDDNYTITADANATATVSNGGAVPEFTTVNTSPNVTVTLAAHGYSVGESFTVDVSTTVGGLTLEGAYLIDSITDADNFVIIHASNATSSASAFENSGNARYAYLIPPGEASTTALIGWGAGGWGTGTWGMSEPSDIAFEYLRIWSLDNFQDTLLACINDGALYEWNAPVSIDNRATAVGGSVPTVMNSMFVTSPQLQVVALGAEVLGAQDPLLVRWCEAGDYTDWVATSVNQAGSYRLSRGSKIIAGIQGSQANHIWTDIDFWIMQYVGLPNVYNFQLLATGCGLIGLKAAAFIAHSIYWMSNKGFFVYTGSAVRPLPCAVWDTIFQDLDTDNQDKCICAVDSAQGEVTWYYPSLSGGTGEVDKYVKYNILTGEWDYGTSDQTAWIDQNILGLPIGAHADGDWHHHGIGYDADDQALSAFARTGYIDIADGEQIAFVDEIIPDLKLLGTDPEVLLTFYAVNHPQADTPVVHGPYTVNNTVKFITPRIRARSIAMKVESTKIDTWWRLGAIRVRVAQDGRMP